MAFENTVDAASASSSVDTCNSETLSSTSLADGSRACGGSGGGPGARGGRRSPFGGGFPCPVDDGGGGGVGGDQGRAMEKVGGVKTAGAGTAAAMETRRAVRPKETSPQKDHGRRGRLLSSGGGGRTAVDGMVGVEAGTVLNQAPKA